MRLRDFDADAFLREHWQKRPLLMRDAWQSWENPLEPDELAGLACEDGVESRLVVQRASGPVVEHGPLDAERFAGLDGEVWTLLVQAVDQQVPAVAALLEAFRFVPEWRIDDVMVSYAVDQGGVGAHYDQYDVFLVQGLGRRRWRVGAKCDAATAMVPGQALHLIDGFVAEDEWVLEPGDMLYLPPGFGHQGVALGDDCMTYSVGFRAPSREELVRGWAERVAEGLGEDDRFADPDLRPQTHACEIAPAALDRLHAMATEALADKAAFARWLGEHVSQPKYPEIDWRPEQATGEAEVRRRLRAGGRLERNPASRFAFVRDGGRATLFVDGEAYGCSVELAERLCGGLAVDGDDAAVGLVTVLVNRGALAFGED